ncbi:MAG: ABC transporter permease [Oscillospiraceae bacterium]|nr:ABC transporter permease [Oscillospiraceae bacterium]
MMEFFQQYNEMLLEGIYETLLMTFASTIFAHIIGLPLGVIMVITDARGISPHKTLNTILGAIINVGRSIPFVILIVAVIPLTRFIVGKAIGPVAAIVPLTIAAAPFVARMVESALQEVDPGVVEAAKTMGATNWQIALKVLLPEAVPSLIRGFSITTITLIGYSAMAGAFGAGGLGDIAIRYGHHRYQADVMWVTVVLIVVIVQVIQMCFELAAKKIDKRNK